MTPYRAIDDRQSGTRPCRECGTATVGQIEYTGGREDGQRFANCRSDRCNIDAMSR